MKYLNSINSCINLISSLNNSFEKEPFPENNKALGNGNDYIFNKESVSDDIKLMHEFIEFKYFKKVMKRNNSIFE